MSISRLVIGVLFLALGAFWIRGRDRIRGMQVNRSGRALRVFGAIGYFYLVLGVLWVVLAFAD